MFLQAAKSFWLQTWETKTYLLNFDKKMEIHFQRETDLKGFKLQSEKEEEKKLWEQRDLASGGAVGWASLAPASWLSIRKA